MVMSFDDDFEDVFGDMDFFNNRFMKRFYKEVDEIFQDIKTGKIKGAWEAREINEPGVKGYIIQGRFGSDELPEPLRPLRRRPLPERPFELSKKDLKETREPLTDVFDEEDATRIYVELPGEEKEDISLDFKKDYVEVKAKNFCKTVALPKREFDKETVKTEYKNGVLKITIPKKAKLRREDIGKERTV